MMIICPLCDAEITPLKDGTCPECESYILKPQKFHGDEFDEEDEFTESDWGQDTTQVKEEDGFSNPES